MDWSLREWQSVTHTVPGHGTIDRLATLLPSIGFDNGAEFGLS